MANDAYFSLVPKVICQGCAFAGNLAAPWTMSDSGLTVAEMIGFGGLHSIDAKYEKSCKGKRSSLDKQSTQARLHELV